MTVVKHVGMQYVPQAQTASRFEGFGIYHILYSYMDSLEIRLKPCMGLVFQNIIH